MCSSDRFMFAMEWQRLFLFVSIWKKNSVAVGYSFGAIFCCMAV